MGSGMDQKMLESLDDEALIRLMRQGEKGISDYLLEKYKGLVLKKARKLFLAGGETDDLIQEGMIGLFQAIRDYQEGREASFQTFAGLCIDRQMYKAIKNSNRQKNMPLNAYVSLSAEEEEALLGQSQDSPETILIDQEMAKEETSRLFEGSSRLEEEVLALFLQGESYEDIAKALGRTTKSVDNALRRIREKKKRGSLL